MPAVFADTFYFIALLDSDDPSHARLDMSGLRLVTSAATFSHWLGRP